MRIPQTNKHKWIHVINSHITAYSDYRDLFSFRYRYASHLHTVCGINMNGFLVNYHYHLPPFKRYRTVVSSFKGRGYHLNLWIPKGGQD